MPCTTELGIDGLKVALATGLTARWGALCRVLRPNEWREIKPEETPAIGIELGQQRIVHSESMLEQDIVLHLRVMAGELTIPSAVEGDGADVPGPAVEQLLNEVVAWIYTLLLDTSTVWHNIPFTVTSLGPVDPVVAAQQAYAAVPLTLRYPRLAAEAWGLA